MIPTWIQVDPEWLMVLDRLHLVVHDLPKDFEDTLAVSLTRRDYALLLLGADLLLQFHQCLEDDLVDLVLRMKELRDAQKPEWSPDGD